MGEEHPHGPPGPRLEGVGAGDPEPHRVLAGADVRNEGTATGHGMAEAVEDLQVGIHDVGEVPLAAPDEDVAAHHLVVGDADQVHGATAAGWEVGAGLAGALECPDPGPCAPGAGCESVVVRESPGGRRLGIRWRDRRRPYHFKTSRKPSPPTP